MIGQALKTNCINKLKRQVMLSPIGLTLCFLSAAMQLVTAQTGTLEGRALDVNRGKPIPGFRLQIPALQKQTTTDSSGHYRFTALPADTYKLKTAHPRYGRFTVDSVIIHANEVTTRNITVEQRESTFYKDNQSPANRTPSYTQERVKKRFNREGYDRIEANDFQRVQNSPLSTFSIDVDRASYANTRRFLENGKLPPKDAVRIEELINYFDYNYPEPQNDKPFAVNAEGGECPWNSDHELLHIGIQGKSLPETAIPASNLVFLVDVSGSMNRPNKLPLVKESLRMLVNQLRPKDRISMVVYAGSSGLVLPSTPGDQKAAINKAIQNLAAGGSTAGSKGIKLAYKQARENFKEDGNNRVILATDGDFNVGVTSDGGLTRLIEEQRESGVYLSVLGFGTGNYQGSKMEKLSNTGNGNYAYIDNKLEAKKTLVQEFGGTMNTIAKDVKLQVEFNPAKIESYRLIGYVNRQLDKADFKNDSVDAGELGSGHSVTALYELVPVSQPPDQKETVSEELRYQERRIKKQAYRTDEIGLLKMRYKSPSGAKSKLLNYPLNPINQLSTTNNFHWAAAVAMFGMELRQSSYKGNTDFRLIRNTAKQGMGDDEKGFRKGFMEMIGQAAGAAQSQY